MDGRVSRIAFAASGRRCLPAPARGGGGPRGGRSGLRWRPSSRSSCSPPCMRAPTSGAFGTGRHTYAAERAHVSRSSAAAAPIPSSSLTFGESVRTALPCPRATASRSSLKLNPALKTWPLIFLPCPRKLAMFYTVFAKLRTIYPLSSGSHSPPMVHHRFPLHFAILPTMSSLSIIRRQIWFHPTFPKKSLLAVPSVILLFLDTTMVYTIMLRL